MGNAVATGGFDTGMVVVVGLVLVVFVGLVAVAVAGAAGAGAGLPNNDDINVFGAGAGAGAGVALVDMVGLGTEETGTVALVDTLMDGVNLKSLLLSLLRISDKSVVSLRKDGFRTGVVGVDLVIVIVGADGTTALSVGVVGADIEVTLFDNDANENGSDLVLVGSTKRDRSSIGITLSGFVPPIFEVVS